MSSMLQLLNFYNLASKKGIAPKLISQNLKDKSFIVNYVEGILFGCKKENIKYLNLVFKKLFYIYNQKPKIVLYNHYINNLIKKINIEFSRHRFNIKPLKVKYKLNQKIPISLVQGDLWLNNIIKNKSDFKIIDWEFAGERSRYRL